jgi:hypothetical protein
MSRKRRTRINPSLPSNALTSSAQVLVDDDVLSKHLVIQPSEPQKEAWQFYRSLGEVQFAIGSWLAGCVSRVRLIAAETQAGGDEPTPLTDGPAAELVSSIAGGMGGQTAMLKKLAVQLSVPGESYLVGEDPRNTGDPSQFDWHVYSSSELNIARRNPLTYRVMEYEGQWRTLRGEYLVCRIWSPDDEYSWRASSAVMSSLGIMREVDYWNRYIIAVLLSRLAMNGMLLIPSEIILPVDERFKDAPDPFLAKLVDTASKAIKQPGTAAAAIPIPLRVPGDWIDKIKHLNFATQVEDKVQEHRQAALTRLATSLNMPAEVLTGMGKVNHWGQWQLAEDAIKIHISPLVEIICHGITQGALQPMADSVGVDLVGPNGGKIIVWYDATELTQQPDKASEAQAAYDRGDMRAESLLRESGFDSEDLPSLEEFKQIALKKIALSASADSLTALGMLTGDDDLISVSTASPAASGEVNSEPVTSGNTSGSPETISTPSLDKEPPDTRESPAPSRTQARICPTCFSNGAPKTIQAQHGGEEFLCVDLWHIEPRDPLVLNIPVNGSRGLIGDVARERHVT